MACFQPDTRAPSTSLLAVAEARLPCFTRLIARLSSILQILNHNVFNAESSLDTLAQHLKEQSLLAKELYLRATPRARHRGDD